VNAVCGSPVREIRTLGAEGGTSASGHAGSVKAVTRKRHLPRGSAKATVARLVPTYHSSCNVPGLEDQMLRCESKW
jgi:hypothetical protein